MRLRTRGHRFESFRAPINLAEPRLQPRAAYPLESRLHVVGERSCGTSGRLAAADPLVGPDLALFYYAGHGVQVRGSNYLVPVNANPAREAGVLFQRVDTALMLAALEGSGTKLNIVILDARRNNSFGGRGLRATAGGLVHNDTGI
jgi:hypothetical protein